MKRPVIVWVDDEQVTDLNVKYLRWSKGEFVFRGEAHVPVPSDDQLTRDIASAARILTGLTHGGVALPSASELDRMAGNLRAAFDLDEGSDDE